MDSRFPSPLSAIGAYNPVAASAAAEEEMTDEQCNNELITQIMTLAHNFGRQEESGRNGGAFLTAEKNRLESEMARIKLVHDAEWNEVIECISAKVNSIYEAVRAEQVFCETKRKDNDYYNKYSKLYVAYKFDEIAELWITENLFDKIIQQISIILLVIGKQQPHAYSPLISEIKSQYDEIDKRKPRPQIARPEAEEKSPENDNSELVVYNNPAITSFAQASGKKIRLLKTQNIKIQACIDILNEQKQAREALHLNSVKKYKEQFHRQMQGIHDYIPHTYNAIDKLSEDLSKEFLKSLYLPAIGNINAIEVKAKDVSTSIAIMVKENLTKIAAQCLKLKAEV